LAEGARVYHPCSSSTAARRTAADELISVSLEEISCMDSACIKR
jgi:hypothetical protein